MKRPSNPGGPNAMEKAPASRRCMAHTRSGRQCRQWAIPGGSVCHYHGGAAPQVRKAAEERLSRQSAEEILQDAVATLGLPRDVEPAQALLEEVQRTAGAVSWLDTVIANMDEEKVVAGRTRMIRLPDGTQRTEVENGKNVWVQLWQEERAHFARTCKLALDAGVAERQVQIAEAQATLMAGAIRGILHDLGVDQHPDAPAVVRSHLTKLSQAVPGQARELTNGTGS